MNWIFEPATRDFMQGLACGMVLGAIAGSLIFIIPMVAK